LHRGAGAPRGGFPAAEKQQARPVQSGNCLDGLGQRGGDFRGLGEAGPSSATSSKGTFWATIIMTCWSFARGPIVTSHTLLPGCCFARCAASKSAWPAQGSKTAGSINSFFSAGPAGLDTGSNVCNGSGTRLPQTTIW
jgi:hypothetical protein